jgi:hypothetical protein
LAFVQKDEDDENQWNLTLEERVCHDHVISSLFAITDEVLVTHSYDDSVIKVWRLNDEGFNCLTNIKLKSPALTMTYDKGIKCLAVMDSECKIGVYHKDYIGSNEEE